MITLNDIRTIVQAKIPFDKGFMYMNGTRFSEDSVKFTIIYDGNAVPYIPYQEYGFVHWKSGKRVEVNQHFIQDDTVNELDFLINTANTSEKSSILKKQTRKNQVRDKLMSQGNLQSLKGNKTR